MSRSVPAIEQNEDVNYFRVYADEQGESHFEDIEVELSPVPGGELSQLFPVQGIIFRRQQPGYDHGWHTAPRRQFVITLAVGAELVASDGEVRRVGPGSVMLAEDLTGKGHITRVIGTEERLSLFVPLPD